MRSENKNKNLIVRGVAAVYFSIYLPTPYEPNFPLMKTYCYSLKMTNQWNITSLRSIDFLNDDKPTIPPSPQSNPLSHICSQLRVRYENW